MQRNDILDNFEFEGEQYFEDGSEVVAKFYSPMEAEVAAARLRTEEIPCFLANSTSQSIMPHVQGLIRLHVRPEDIDRARILLAEAAIDFESPTAPAQDEKVLVFLAVAIGLVLAFLLVKAMWSF